MGRGGTRSHSWGGGEGEGETPSMLLRIQILLHITGDNCVACSIGVYVYCVCLRSTTRDIFVYVVCLVAYQAAFPSRHAERRSMGNGMWEMRSTQEYELLERGGPLPVCIQQCTPGNVRIAVSMQVGRARNNSAVRLCGGGVVCTECIRSFMMVERICWEPSIQ